MKKESKTDFIIKLYYSATGADIGTEIQKAILLFVEREVKKLCMQNS